MTKKNKKTKKVNEAIYDPGDTVPVRGVNGLDTDNHPLLAVKYAEEHGLGPNDTIINCFTPDEKKQLLKMCKNGEFNQLETAVIHYLMSEVATLEDLGAMIGAVSRRTHGEPTSKVGALKELNRILAVIAKRSKAKFGKEIDLKKAAKYMKEMKKIEAWRKKKERDAWHYANKVEREFWQNLKELRQEQSKHGLPTAKLMGYDEWIAAGKPKNTYPYPRKFAPMDKDISKMKQFGGSPDERD